MGSPRRSIGRCRSCTQRSRRRSGGGRSPTKCPRRSSIVSIVTPATSGSRVFTLSSAILDSPWFDDRSTPNVIETRDDIARQAADDALAVLRARFGEPAEVAMERGTRRQVFASAVGRRPRAGLVLQPRACAGRRRQHDRQQNDDRFCGVPTRLPKRPRTGRYLI